MPARNWNVLELLYFSPVLRHRFFFGPGGTRPGFSRPKIRSGTRCAHQFWPQCARSAASAGARLAAGPAAGQAARARARIQPKSQRASSQISEFRSCMHSVSWIHDLRDVAARKPRAEYTRGLTIVGEAWDYMGNLTEVVYSISSVY